MAKEVTACIGFFAVLLIILITGCTIQKPQEETTQQMQNNKNNSQLKTATFAGGCFWCVEQAFSALPGVVDVVSGYAGGATKNPTYEEVSSGQTGHVEAVQITFDPTITLYNDLLEIYWRSIDPTDDGGQFADRGEQYVPVLFYHDDTQKKLAEDSKKRLDEEKRFDRPVVTPIKPFTTFYPAEEYHQEYYKKNPLGYKAYKKGSGREDFISEYWSAEELLNNKNKKQPRQANVCTFGPARTSSANAENTTAEKKTLSKDNLTALEFDVTQNNATEAPFNNKYWNNTEEGIYVDVVSGEPLFSSNDKFDSGSGWPSFTKPIDKEMLIENADKSFFMERVEVRSKTADSHLGHLFNDGPGPTRLRYCINSAALRFIPKKDLEKEGYGKYKTLF